MNYPKTQHYLLRKNSSISAFLRELRKLFDVTKSSLSAKEFTIYDDFYSSIWNSGSILVYSQEEFELRSPNVASVRELADQSNKFWWDFSDNKLKAHLKSLIGLRAISPSISFNLDESDIVLKDSEGKILVRVKLLVLLDNGEKLNFISVNPLRGYEQEFKKAIKVLTNYADQTIDQLDIRSIAIRQGYEANSQPKLSYTPSKEISSEECLRKMSSELLKATQIHENGIIDDIDTEFLHQYRVNLRKIRSLINLLKKTLPETEHLNIKEKLARLASRTNKLRDLDVFLLDRKKYLAMLPESSQEGLNILFNKVTVERTKEHRNLSKWLASGTYNTTLNSLVNDFETPPKMETLLASENIYDVSKKLISKRFKKVKLLGSAIDDSTPDDEVHELRIECKKLRYLMEFFIDLYPQSTIKGLIKNLKSLQTILGDFNDCCVQKEFLNIYDEKYGSEKTVSNAIHSLIAVLHQTQLQKRSEVCEAFDKFRSEKTQSEFMQLFSN